MKKPDHSSEIGQPKIRGRQLPKILKGATADSPADTQTDSPTDSAIASPPQKKSPPPRRFQLPHHFRYWLMGFGIVGVVAFALRPSPIAVDFGTVQRGTLLNTIEAEGETRVSDRFTIAAPVDGRLSRIDLESGDAVRSGTVIAQIDALPLNTQVKATQARLRELRAQLAGVETQRVKPAALAQAESQINAAIASQQAAAARYQEARSNLAQATRDRQRAQQLEAAGAQSRKAREDAELLETQRRQEVEAAKRQVDAAIANVNSAKKASAVLQAEQQDPDYLLDVYRAQIASAEAALTNLVDEAQRTSIIAPSAGKVLRVLQKSARFVQAGEPLIELGNAAQLELVMDILSTDAIKVKPGARIQIVHWGGTETLEAKVRYVEPSAFTKVSALGVEEQRVNVIADFIAPPPPALGDGYRVDAQIVVWEGHDVLKVPLSALFRCNEQAWCTFVNAAGKAQQRQVEVGNRSDLEAVIKDGLKSGEQVILYPSEQIKSGQRVTSRS